MGSPRGPVEDVCETEVGMDADVEDEVVDVVGRVAEFGVSGYESEGLKISEILRRKRLSKKGLSEGAFDTFHFPQCEFSNLQHLPFTFLLELSCWPVIELCSASCAAPAETRR